MNQSSMPILRSVENAQNFHPFVADSIDDNVRQAKQEHLACSNSSPLPATIRQILQRTDLGVNPLNRGLPVPGIALPKIITDMLQVIGCGG